MKTPFAKKNYVKFAFYLMHLVGVSTAYTQQLDLAFTPLGEEQGFKGEGVNAFIYEDHLGLTWIGSMRGIYRFDGQLIKYYSISSDGKYSENVQSSFFEDEYNNLWFTTVDGLHCYNRQTDSFHHKQLSQNGKLLKENYSAFHFQKKSGILWMIAEKKMFAYDTIKDSIISDFHSTEGIRFVVDTTESGEVNRIFAFNWVQASGFEAWSINSSGQWCENLFLEELTIRRGVLESDSIIWLVTNKELLEYNFLNGEIIKSYVPENNKGRAFNSIIRYNSQFLLLSSKRSGIWAFDTHLKSFSHNWKSSEQQGSISYNSPHDLYLGKSGRLWVDFIEAGLDYSILLNPSYSNPLPHLGDNLLVRNIIEDADGKIWVLVSNEGIFVFNQSEELLFNIKEVGELDDFSSAHLSRDKKGAIWLVMNKTIFRYQVAQVNWEFIIEDKNRIYSLNHDIGGKTIALTTAGVVELCQNKDSFDLKFLPPLENYNNFDFKYFFKVDDRLIFTPFKDRQLWVIDISANPFELVRKIDLGAEAYDIHNSLDSQHLWIASRMGLHLYAENIPLKLVLNQKHFGENTSVYKILERPTGVLWLLTDRGLWTYDIINQQLIRHTQDNTLLAGSLYSQGAGIQTSSDKMWFAAKQGLLVFNPKLIQLSHHPPSSYIEKIWVNDKIYRQQTSNQGLKKLQLRHFENTLAFELRLMDYQGEGKIRYRLKGLMSDWIWLKEETAEFINLPAGQYQLEVEPLNRYHQEGKIKRLDIHIPLPYWKTWWFRGTIILSFIIILYLAIRAQFQKKIRLQKRLLAEQKMINKERDRIAKELHDDMGGRLSSILFLSEDLQLEHSNKNSNGPISRISELTQQALANMKDIIWALDETSHSLEAFSSRVHTYASELLTDHQIELETLLQFNDAKQFLPGSEGKRNLLFLVKECLHNIVKHSAASKVVISMDSSPQSLKIQIEDNGKGFSLSGQSGKGRGLENIRKRSIAIGGELDIHSHPALGTTVTINVPLKLELKL